MHKSCTSSILVALLLPLAACQTKLIRTNYDSTTRASCRVFSFNIAGESKNWETRKAACYAAINAYEPDIIGFQELLPVNLEWALENFTRLRWYGPTIEGRPEASPTDAEGESCRILYNGNRFSADTSDSGAFWFSSMPDVSSEEWEDLRYCVYARLVDKNTGDRLYVFNTHWSYSSQESRNRGAQLVVERIVTRAHTEDPFIVTGDFNARESDEGIQILLRRMTPVLQNRVDCVFVESASLSTLSTEVVMHMKGAAISDHNVLLSELMPLK